MPSGKQEAAMATGIRKINNGWGNQDSVLVKYPHGAEMEIPASQYVAQGHHPPIDALPVLSSLFHSEQSRFPAALKATSASPT
jgi:hypothetical protein